MENDPSHQQQDSRTVLIETLSPFDWADQADELGDNLQAAAQARLGATAFSSAATEAASADYVFRVDANDMRSHLLLQPRNGELRIAVVGPPPRVDDDVALWAEIVRDAIGLGLRPRVSWPWAAIIAPAGNSSNPGPCLAGTTLVDSLTLRPASRAIRRSVRPIPWSPSRPISNAWPVIVEGSGWTYDWRNSLNAQHRARAQLHRLCALLTVVFDGVPWRLEREPSGTPPGYLVVPDELLDADVPDVPFGQRPIEMPSWIGDAWVALDADPRLGQALALYYEGAQLRGAHPSLALVALVGSIESLARTTLERCESCGQLKGSTRRFKDALAEALSEHEAEELGRLYASRSKTAHAGVLFGFETTFNVWEQGHFIPLGGRLDFTMRLTYLAQHAGALLLARRFQEAADRQWEA